MSSKLNKAALLISFLSITACEKASDTVVNIPNVRVGCTNTDSVKCDSGSAGQNSVVIMSRSGCDVGTVGFDGVATGSVQLQCDPQGCEGTISSWTDPENSASVTEILTGRMDICSTIYVDGGVGTPSVGDLVDESSESIGSSATITIDSWREVQ